MKVELLYHTPEPERAIATAARVCYSAVGASELKESMTDEQVRHLIDIVTASGHSSTLEHASYTFAAGGLSRACTHQLVRHRIASFNQQSQRYVKFENQSFEWVIPGSVSEDAKAEAIYVSALSEVHRCYDQLLELEVPAEDARMILPNACPSNIVITMNCRELMHFFSLRCCNRAQWEIRDLAWRMLRLAKESAPYLFKDAGPSCIRGACPEGKMTCGTPYSLT